MKKFTKGCAVDVRGMSQVVFDAICKTIGTSFRKRDQEQMKYLSITERDDFKLSRVIDHSYDLLTPTDILGPELVKAIEEGYTPWFEGDEVPSGEVEVILDTFEFVKRTGDSKAFCWDTLDSSVISIIAYKPIEQPSFESKALSEKVGNHNHYFKDVSHLETVDVYRVIDLFEVVNPCHQHAIKKILCCGQRGAKDAAKDTQEAIDSLKRALEMMREDDAVK